MKKKILSLILVLSLLSGLFMFSAPAYAADGERAFCIHENASWKLAFPATPVTDAHYRMTCPDCGFTKTAVKYGSSFIYRFIDLLSGLVFPPVRGGLSDSFTVTAHTGPFEIPMNSKFSLDYQLISGADVVEFDLAMNSDGVAVLAHGDPDEAKMTLEEAFEKLSSYYGIQANVDVKNINAVAQCEVLAAKYGVIDRIFYTGVFENNYSRVKTESPDVPFYINIDPAPAGAELEAYYDGFMARIAGYGAAGVNLSYEGLSHELVQSAHEHGLLVSAWTVNSPIDMYKVLSYGVDNITSEFPHLLRLITNGFVNRLGC